MSTTLNAEEARIIGSLIEKSIVTPDQYPLTLNALTNACNQKSARDPAMALTRGEVQRVCRLLAGKGLLRIDENFRSGVEKYSQTLCNTRYGDYHFEPPALALVCVLLLRGPQTPGELRTNCRRLYDFPDNHAVTKALTALAERERGAVVQQLPRAPGRRDSEYVHLFSGAVDVEAYAARGESTARDAGPKEKSSLADLERRVSELETAVAELRERR